MESTVGHRYGGNAGGVAGSYRSSQAGVERGKGTGRDVQDAYLAFGALAIWGTGVGLRLLAAHGQALRTRR